MRKNAVLQFWEGLLRSCNCDETGSPTIEFDAFGARVIFTADEENLKAILATQFADYGKGPKFHGEWKEFLGDSIFTTDGDLWHGSRQLIRPMFMRERVADLDLIEQHTAKLIALMGPGDGRQIRLDKLLSRFTLDAATHFLFGHSAGSLDDENAKFGIAFDEVQRIQALNVRAGPLKFLIPRKPFVQGLKTMEEFIDPWINETLQLTSSQLEAKLSKSDTFIHALARVTRDRSVIRDQLVSLLLAGRDTTASTLSWIFLELARNPHVVTKLKSEILSVIGSSTIPPTYDHIKEMKYLTAIINETLRLYSPVPYNVRASLVDTTLPTGGGPDGKSPIGCPKGTIVGYSTLIMQRRRTNNYPPSSPDPLLWDPERWQSWTPKPWTFIPFNGGPRICIGQQFAMVEMGYTISRIFQEFDAVVDYGNENVLVDEESGRMGFAMKTEILLTPAAGVKIGFVKNGENEK